MAATKGTRKRTRKDVAPVEVTPLEPVTLATPLDRHKRRLADVLRKRVAVNDANKAQFLALMRIGEMPTMICDAHDMPSLSAFRAAMAIDEQFASDYEQAYSVMADMVLEDAMQFARDSTSLANVDAQRIADTYIKSIASTLEKLAPRSYGVLVKHAGAEGGPLTVAVINYADHKPRVSE